MFKYKFCLWLIDKLRVKPLTFKEIQTEWKRSAINGTYDYILTERSFNRYRRDAESLMDIVITCDKRNGNVYTIENPEELAERHLQDWLLSAFRISDLAQRVKSKKHVMIESAPPAAHLLQTVMDAIDDGLGLSFEYKSHYSSDKRETELTPAFVRLFKQRWYLVGEVVSATNNTKVSRTFALERISDLKLTETKMTLSKQMQEKLQPSTYFEDCFGIINDNRIAPCFIRFRAFWPQNAYIKDVPLHASQQVVSDATADYTDFEIYVRPTYDLKQEFLWHRDKVAILSPESFRQDMIGVVKAMLKGYETGEYNAIDE